MNVKLTYLTTLGWFNSFSNEISLMAVLGTPSDSLENKVKISNKLQLATKHNDSKGNLTQNTNSDKATSYFKVDHCVKVCILILRFDRVN